MSAVENLLQTAQAEVGYLEKKSNSQLDSKTGNAGDNNYTKYARDLYPSLQAQPWCDMFVDWCFVQGFGDGPAKQLLCGGFSAYTPTSAQYYKNKGRYYKSDPLPGDQIFFRNDTRIYHTGIVYKVTSSKVYTIEGNTSSGSEVIANGGAVCQKEYALTNSRIDGYGRPDWSLVEQPEYTMGWNHDKNGWWYADSKTTYYKSCWQIINGHKYYFNPDGYAVTDWQVIDCQDFYFEPRAGHPLECALYVSDRDGVQGPGKF
ncbi:CHAP domain-containing protein [Lacrimispora indolis]|uniref:CHAP domain-containing protein n=1 Tax=Lacrimispora indolis TaxID=69825 RepID=UPI00045E99C6|nr:CHAP domain-containing protein [Lacrimispora indolis]MBE7718826.1 CHAP domain-containing protein [Lacrimispora celerecrescens]